MAVNWTMIGTIVAGLTAILAVLIHLSNKKTQADDRKRERKEAKIDALVNEYHNLHMHHIDSGPNALSKIGIENLENDNLIRECIQRIEVRCGYNPWGRFAIYVGDIDLYEFFKFARVNKINFHMKGDMVEQISKKIREI